MRFLQSASFCVRAIQVTGLWLFFQLVSSGLIQAQWNPPQGPYGGLINYLIVDPQDPETVYTKTDAGRLYKTMNRGADWTQIPGPPEPLGQVAPLAIDPQNSAVLYVGIRGGLFKTTDGGASWVKLTNGPPAVRSWAIDPQDPDVVYAAASSVFRSTDGGNSWEEAGAGLPGESSLVIRTLIVDPQSSAVYAAMNWVEGSKEKQAIFKTTNRGQSWTAMHDGIPDEGTGCSRCEGTGALVIDPDNTSVLYALMNPADPLIDALVYRTANGAQSWVAASNGLPGHCDRVLAIDPANGAQLYVGCRQGVFKTTNSGATWTGTNAADGTIQSATVRALAVTTGPNPAGAGPSAPTGLAGLAPGGVYRSTDGGIRWNSSDRGILADVRSLAADPQDPSRVLAGTSDGKVFQTKDKGASWSIVGRNPVALGQAVLALVFDPRESSTIYAGLIGGFGAAGLFKNTGAAWKEANNGLPANEEVTALAIDPVDSSTLFAGTSEGVFRSGDGAASWTEVSSGLSDQRVLSLVVDPASPNTVFAGTRGGVFRTDNGATSWTAKSNGLPNNVVVAGLALDPESSALCGYSK